MIAIIFSVLVLIIMSVAVFGSNKHNSISEYELYGEKGADEWERNQMGIGNKKYKKNKNGFNTKIN